VRPNFNWDNMPSRRLRADMVNSAVAERVAKIFSRAEQHASNLTCHGLSVRPTRSGRAMILIRQLTTSGQPDDSCTHGEQRGKDVK
jgi:hypothetical protein